MVLRNLLITFGAGAVFLVPSLVLLYGLFLRGIVQSPYERLDERLDP